MSFCELSSEFFLKNKTEVDNSFLECFLPSLPDVVVKTYIYGLYLCQNPQIGDNSLEKMANNLKLKEEDIKEHFRILEAENLVQIIKGEAFRVKYVVAPEYKSNRKFNSNKYKQFNIDMQDLFSGSRMITQTEYERYYEIIEDNKIEKDALLLIAKYAVGIKGKNVGYAYINTIAKNWASEGIKTVEDVNNKLLEQERVLGKLQDILKALKIYRIASIEERQTYIKWKKELGFTDEAILFAVKYAKNSFNKLDLNLNKYATIGILNEKEIEGFEKNKKQILELAKDVVKNLGLYYENSEPVIENYITPWLNLGFSETFIKDFAKMCFKKNVRTLEGMDVKIKALYKKGVLTSEALDELNKNIVVRDNKIREVLKSAGLVREVTNFDRSMFNTWTTSWGMEIDVICYVASLAEGTLNPMQYINKILKDYKAQGINSVEQAKKLKITVSNESKTKKVNNSNDTQNSYNTSELNSLFASLDEVNDD